MGRSREEHSGFLRFRERRAKRGINSSGAFSSDFLLLSSFSFSHFFWSFPLPVFWSFGQFLPYGERRFSSETHYTTVARHGKQKNNSRETTARLFVPNWKNANEILISDNDSRDRRDSDCDTCDHSWTRLGKLNLNRDLFYPLLRCWVFATFLQMHE